MKKVMATGAVVAIMVMGAPRLSPPTPWAETWT